MKIKYIISVYTLFFCINMEKDFDKWNDLKKEIEYKSSEIIVKECIYKNKKET